MRRPALALFVLVALAACALLPAAARAGAEEPGPEAVPRAAKAPAEEVELRTDDGFTLHADLRAARDPKAPVAILLHQYTADRRSWAPLAPALAAAGFTVLALDQRAHGESTRQGEKKVLAHEIPRAQFGAVVRAGVHDVQAARSLLAARGVATDRIALVGASYGCSVSLLSASAVQGVRALVLLSPGTDYFGVSVVEAARGFPGPLLAVAAEDDPPALSSLRNLADAHAGEEEQIVYPSGGHGTNLFASRPELAPRIVEFLRNALEP